MTISSFFQLYSANECSRVQWKCFFLLRLEHPLYGCLGSHKIKKPETWCSLEPHKTDWWAISTPLCHVLMIKLVICFGPSVMNMIDPYGQNTRIFESYYSIPHEHSLTSSSTYSLTFLPGAWYLFTKRRNLIDQLPTRLAYVVIEWP